MVQPDEQGEGSNDSVTANDANTLPKQLKSASKSVNDADVFGDGTMSAVGVQQSCHGEGNATPCARGSPNAVTGRARAEERGRAKGDHARD